jgi:hypothetical protein
MSGPAVGVPITFEIDTFGRLESGALQTDPLFVSFRYTFASDAPDRDPSEGFGSYEAGAPALSRLRIGREVATGAFDVDIFTSSPVFPHYTVATSWSGSTFLGRSFFAAFFDFIDFEGNMLTSDDLPTSPRFALRADRFAVAFFYVPIEGDADFGAPTAVFRVCDARFDGCVPAPMLLRRAFAIPEPASLALVGMAIVGLVIVRLKRPARSRS